MTRRERLREEYEDALFALLMDEVAEQEGKRLLKENERLKHDPNAAVPDEVSQRCRRVIKRSFAKEQRREAGRFAGRALSKVSLVAMIAILLFATAFAAVPQVRVGTLNFLIEVSDVATNLRMVPGEPNSTVENNSVTTQVPGTLRGYCLPEIPDSFVLVDQLDGVKTSSLWYCDDTDSEIVFDISNVSSAASYNVDTEDAEVEYIQINGYEGLLIEKGDWINIVWGDTDRSNFVSIRCRGFSKDLVLSYAEAMEYCG